MDSIDWTDLRKNTVDSLKYACQQLRIFPKGRKKEDYVFALSQYRRKQLQSNKSRANFQNKNNNSMFYTPQNQRQDTFMNPIFLTPQDLRPQPRYDQPYLDNSFQAHHHKSSNRDDPDILYEYEYEYSSTDSPSPVNSRRKPVKYYGYVYSSHDSNIHSNSHSSYSDYYSDFYSDSERYSPTIPQVRNRSQPKKKSNVDSKDQKRKKASMTISLVLFILLIIVIILLVL